MTPSEVIDSSLNFPDFICIGVQKAGTTTLFDILKKHPQIFLSEKKETKFFQYDEDFAKGMTFYSNYFRNVRDEKVIGEIDPSYIFFADKTAPRIKDTLGARTKLIVTLRNPVDRAYSQYLMSVLTGAESLTFEEAIASEENRMRSSRREDIINFSYISRGRYVSQLKKYFEFFPEENFLILIFEKDIANNLDKTLQKVAAFLGVEAGFSYDAVKSNPSRKIKSKSVANFLYGENSPRRFLKYLLPVKSLRKKMRKGLVRLNEKESAPEKISPEFRRELYRKYFEKEIAGLEQLLNVNLSIWKPE